MAKVTINSKSNDVDVELIEGRLDLLLSSVMSNFSTINVNLQLKDDLTAFGMNYRCEVEGVHENSKRFLVSSEHPNAIAALEGAAQRLKRSVVRARQFI